MRLYANWQSSVYAEVTLSLYVQRARMVPRLLYRVAGVGRGGRLTDPHVGINKFLHECGVDIPVKMYITNENASSDVSAAGDWEIFDGDGRICKLDLSEKATTEIAFRGIPKPWTRKMRE